MVKFELMMMVLKKIRSLDLDEMYVANNGTLPVSKGALWDTKNALKRIFFS